MAQFLIYGRDTHLRAQHARISEVLDAAAVRTLQLPVEKRFHRFIPLEDWQLLAPSDRSERYTIVEVHMFAGRTREVRKALLRALMDDLSTELALSPNDIEVIIMESPRENWGIRGQHGDEMQLSYKVEI